VATIITCLGPIFVIPLFALTAPVMIIENLGPLASIKRGVQLVVRRYWQCLGIIMLATIAAYIADQALTLFPQAIGVALDEPWNWIVLGASRTLVAMLITPALAGVSILLYIDLRVRTEGLDIELKAADAFPVPA
jgi:hypothetical protein